MNYIRELNAFIDWLETNPLDATAQALWFHLMAICNKCGWPEWFAVANLTLQAKLNITENTLARHRNTLVQKGRIEYKPQGKRQAGKYRIIPFEITSKNEANITVKNEVIEDNLKICANHEANLEVIPEVISEVISEVKEPENPEKSRFPDAPKLNKTKHKLNNNVNNTKIKYAEFVSMTNDEYSSLVARLGSEERAKRCIEILDNYKGATGKKYKSDYRAILNWVISRLEEEEQRKQKVVNINAGSDANTGKAKSKYAIPDDFYWP